MIKAKVVRVGKLASLTVMAMSLAACATMFAPKTVEVRFKTAQNDGSELYVQGKKYALNGEPILLSKKTKTVLFSNPEFGDYIVPLNRKVNGGWIALDFFFSPGFGLSGLLVDAGSSNWYRYPATVDFDFASKKVVQTNADKTASRTVVSLASPKAATAIRGVSTTIAKE